MRTLQTMELVSIVEGFIYMCPRSSPSFCHFQYEKLEVTKAVGTRLHVF